MTGFVQNMLFRLTPKIPAIGLLCVALPANGLDYGHLQIESPDLTQVHLNKRPMGTTDETGQLLLRGLSSGPHRVHLLRPGFSPQGALVFVEPGGVAVYQPQVWIPDQKLRGNAVLAVDTLPWQTTISSSSLGFSKIEKGPKTFVARGLSKGRHKLTFCTEHMCMDYNAQLRAGQVVKLLVDFNPGSVENASDAISESWRRAKKQCLAEKERTACLEACEYTASFFPTRNEPACDTLRGALQPRLSKRKVSNPKPVAISKPTNVPCVKNASGGFGFVSIKAKLGTKLFVGSKYLGEAPLTKHRFPAGCVEIRVVQPKEKTDRTIQVEVKRNQLSVFRAR